MSKTKGLDFEKARQEADKTGWEPWEGSWLTVFHTHLQAQHATLLAEAVAEARREERGAVTSQWQALLDAEKVSSDSRVLLLRLDYAPVVAAVREWQEAEHKWGEVRIDFAADRSNEVAIAARRDLWNKRDALLALPLPPEAE